LAWPGLGDPISRGRLPPTTKRASIRPTREKREGERQDRTESDVRKKGRKNRLKERKKKNACLKKIERKKEEQLSTKVEKHSRADRGKN